MGGRVNGETCSHFLLIRNDYFPLILCSLSCSIFNINNCIMLGHLVMSLLLVSGRLYMNRNWWDMGKCMG